MTDQSMAPDLTRDDIAPSHKPEKTRSEAIGATVYALIWVSGLIVTALMVWGGFERQTVGILVLVLMLHLMAINVPIGLSMVLASAVGFYVLGGMRVVDSSLTTQPFDAVASWSLSVVPLFILLGMIIWKGGLADLAYEACRQWFGHVPGGLAVATNFAGAGMAAGSGSTIGTAYALGRMSLPQMLSSGYHAPIATGVVAMAGTLGQIIPPSILLVIFAGVAETPIGPQLIAGLIPGLVLAAGYAILVIVRVTLKPSLAPAPDLSDITWVTRLKSLAGLLPLGGVIFVVIGGMFLGFFTATESASFGVLAAIIVAWNPWSLKGRRSMRDVVTIVRTSVGEAAVALAGIVFLIIGAVALTRVLAMSGVTRQVTDALLDLNLGRVGMLLLLIVFFIILGMFLDPLPMILLTVPVLQEPLEALGVDMIWFGVFIVVLAEMGIVTPPVGILGYVVHRIAQNPEVNMGVKIKITDVFKGVIPFLCVTTTVLVLMVLWPEWVTWLSGHSASG